jgi:thioredoxin 1
MQLEFPAMNELEEIRAKKLAELQAHVQEKAQRTAAKPVHLTDDTFDAETSAGVVLVDMWAAWCGPCLRIAPVIEQVAEDYAGKVRVGKLNVDENPGTAGRFEVDAIPMLLVFKDGAPVDRIVGAVPRAEIERVLRRWI